MTLAQKLMFTLMATFIALLMGCKEEEKQVVKEPIRPVEFYTVVSTSSLYTQNFPALVEPSNETDLSFRVSGEVIEVNVVAGTILKKGDIVAKLDPTDYKVKVDKAQAQYDLASKTFMRQERMLALELTSQADYDLVLAQMNLAKAELQSARNNLKYTVLKAPYNGLVSKLEVDNRQVVGASQTVVSFHAEDGIDISFQLPESILSRINIDAQKYKPLVSFTSAPQLKNQTFRASFKEMDQTPDPKSRSYTVVITMSNPSEIPIVPGMTANVQIELDQILDGLEPYVLVPVESVFSPPKSDPAKKEYAVWLIDPETMTTHQKMVTISGLKDQGVKVTSGLEEGDIIAAAGVHSLLENTKVRQWIKQRGI